LTWYFGPYAALQLQGGYLLGREFGSGRNQSDGLRDRIEVESGSYLEAALNLRW
jgi:hypothetical protein